MTIKKPSACALLLILHLMIKQKLNCFKKGCLKNLFLIGLCDSNVKKYRKNFNDPKQIKEFLQINAHYSMS